MGRRLNGDVGQRAGRCGEHFYSYAFTVKRPLKFPWPKVRERRPNYINVKKRFFVNRVSRKRKKNIKSNLGINSQDGKAYGWSELISVHRFFFPYRLSCVYLYFSSCRWWLCSTYLFLCWITNMFSHCGWSYLQQKGPDGIIAPGWCQKKSVRITSHYILYSCFSKFLGESVKRKIWKCILLRNLLIALWIILWRWQGVRLVS